MNLEYTNDLQNRFYIDLDYYVMALVVYHNNSIL